MPPSPTSTLNPVTVGVGPLTEAAVVAVARHGAHVSLADDALAGIRTSRALVEALADDVEPHYGISTGFGALANRHIPVELRQQLQASLVRSHSAGTGPEVEREVVRALMLLRLSTLATGRTGVREITAQTYAALLNAGITPVVHEYGSLGCSGDLAPLAHCALAVMGEGPVRDSAGSLTTAASALAAAGIEPVVLREKEGLALINGTDGMLGMLVLALHDLRMLLATADVTAAMSVEGLLGTDAVFAADLQALRPQPGQAVSAATMLAVLAGSPIMASHRGPGCTRVQDAYSLRCAPQVTGAARDTVDYAALVASRELASAVDNPVITLDGRVESNGNFHGAPVAYVLDFLAIVAADVASMAERRTDRFLDASRSPGPAPVPRRRPRCRLGLHDRAVHPGRDRLRAQAPGRSRERRLDPELGHAGGPCLHGVVRCTQAAAVGRRADPGARDRAAHGGPRHRAARAAPASRGDRLRDCRSASHHVGPRSRPHAVARDRGGHRVRPYRRCSRRRRAVHQGELTMQGARPVRAARGLELTAKSWQTEAPMRMLMNNLDPENAERPDDLVVYGGTGRAARDWRSFDAIVRTLTTLERDETLLVQSGRPVGVMQTHEWAPRVLIANSNLVPDWANWPEFRRLENLGLTMYGQMTAGSWIYIGTQGILQGTYETFAAVAAKRFNGTLAGTLTLTAGCGGMGGAQPLAVTLNGGVCLIVDIDESHLRRRVDHRYLDELAPSLDEAVSRALQAKSEGRPLSVGVVGNAAEVFPELLRRGVAIDIVTDQTSAHDPLSYVPVGVALEDAPALAEAKPEEFTDRARVSMATHVEAMVGFMDAGAEVFDYGNSIRDEARHGGYERAFAFPGFVPAYIRPLFCEGKGPFRWVALSGDAKDIHTTDKAVMDLFPDNDHLQRWMRAAQDKVAFQGLPARICWLGYGERDKAGERFNELVASGEVSAPIVIGRDHLDCGSVASPYRETESMLDGSDAIADWPLLNAMVNVASGASWVSIHHGGGVGIGRSIHAGQVTVADGTALAGEKIRRVLTNDPGMGVIRHVDAGYDDAIAVAAERGVAVPMLSQP